MLSTSEPPGVRASLTGNTVARHRQVHVHPIESTFMVDGCVGFSAVMAAQAGLPRTAGDDARLPDFGRPSWLAVVILVGLIHAVLFRLAIGASSIVRPPAAVTAAAISVRWISPPAPSAAATTPASVPPVVLMATPTPVPAVQTPPVHRRTLPKPMVIARATVAPPPAAASPADRPAPPEPPVPSAGSPDTRARDGLRVTPPRANAADPSNPPPDYPAAARDHRQEGRVVLRVLVAADGRPQEVSVARGCGFPLLDQAAVVAVQRWRFVPAQRDGAAVDAAVLVPITFKLRT